MNLKILFFLILGLFVAPIHANEVPSNAPTDREYLVFDGKIYTFATGTSYDYDTTSFSCSTYEEAEAFIAAWYEWLAYYDTLGLPSVYEPGKPDTMLRPNLSSWYPNPLSDLVIVPRYSGSEVVSYYVIWSIREHGTNTNGSSRLFKGAMAGLNTQWHATATPFNAFCASRGVRFVSVPDNGGAHWIYYADAEYIDVPEEPEVTPPEGMADGCVTFYEGAWRYTSEYEGPTGDILLQGQAMYAETEEMANRCAADFATFLESYDWPYYGKPEVLPWSEPLVQKCYVIRNGEVSTVFWRIFFYDLSDPVCPYYSAWNQCLYDYTQSGSGCGGENGIIIYGLSSTASASNTGSAQLNGVLLATGDSGTSSVRLASGGQDVTVTQYTAQKVDAEDESFGTSEVTSEASVSEGSDGSINVTNNTTINTNIELGNAPEGGEFEDTSELEEKEVSDFFSREGRSEDPPAFVYVESYNDSYRINYGKLWEDIKQELSSVLPIESLEKYFDRKVSSGSLPVIPLQASFPEVGFFLDYTIDFNEVLNNEIVRVVRQILGFLLVFETAILCLGFVRG